MRRALLIAAVLAALPATSGAYYHFLRYGSSTAPYQPMPQKFDLRALPGKTVNFYVSEKGPDLLAQGDSLAALLSQVRRAGEVWNGVSTSDLRLSFGGVFTPGRQGGTPRIEVSFPSLEEMEVPPGVVAIGGPEVTDGPVDGSFLPIVRSVVYLNNDFSTRPSWDPAVFMTIAHEIGHALGLQHTFTSSLMSVAVTRATTVARPIAADDVAALSSLYPSPEFHSRFGSISGRVTMSDAGVHMASVVALTAAGEAVSALTLPDGTFKIDGLLPSDYYIYVHPLPPALDQKLGPGDIVLPIGPDGNPIPAGGFFGTVFYPGTRDVQQASTVRVAAGATTQEINFAVTPKESLALHGVRRYSYPGSIAVPSGHVNVGYPLRSFLMAWGYGMVVASAPAPGLKVDVLGGSVSVPEGGIRPYALDPIWVQIDFTFNMFVTPGPRHLVFSLNDDLYVLPSGLNVVQTVPPSITAVENGLNANGLPVVYLTGTGLTQHSRVLFDGAPARVLELSESGDRLTVVPPSAPAAHQARIEVLNGDGQLASFIQTLPAYTYGDNGQQAVSISPGALLPGTEAMVEITGVNTAFTEGLVTAGFGSGDFRVRRVWTVSPTQVRANVVVGPMAPAGFHNLTVTSGLQFLTVPAALEVKAAVERPVSLGSDLVNAETGDSYIYPGAITDLPALNVEPASGLVLTIDRVPVHIQSIENGRIRFEVPRIPAGPAIARLYRAEAEIAKPVIIFIDEQPPVIQALNAGEAQLASAAPALQAGTALTLLVSGLGDPAVPIDTSRVTLSIGGVIHSVVGVITAAEGAGRQGMHVISVVLSDAVQPGTVPVTVSLDGRKSRPVQITVAGAPAQE
ncbi:MAG TPA: IPT/TIG domain-containing protein [Bryobacteraceae bacterium]|nr:IPT/TIG domain-containing protein [Bryobacteraceae bacterium]